MIALLCLLHAPIVAQQQTRERRAAGGKTEAQDQVVQQDTSLSEAQKKEFLTEAERLSGESEKALRSRDYRKALLSEMDALKLRIKVLGRDHYSVAQSMGYLAVLLHRGGMDDMAANFLHGSMLAYKAGISLSHKLGDSTYKAALIYEAAQLHGAVGEYQAAHDYYTFAAITYRKIADRDGEARARKAAEEVAALMRESAGAASPAPDKPEQVMQTGHDDSPELAFSPDGRLLATGASDDTVKLWDVATGRVLRNLYGAQEPVVFSRDGRQLLTGDTRGLVTLWDVATGERHEMRTIPYERTFTVFAAAFSPDGTSLVTAHGDGAVSTWDVPLRMETGTIGMHGREHHDNGHVSTEKDEDGGLMLSIGNRFRIEGKTAKSVAFSPDGRVIASCGDDDTVKLWDEPTGMLLHTLTAGNDVQDLAFSPDGRRLASVDGAIGDKTLKVWDAATGKLLRSIKVESQNIVGSVAFSPDGRLLAAGSHDVARLWDATTGRELHSLKGAHGDVAFSPDGRALATGSGGFYGHSVTLWDVTTGREVRTLDEDAPSVGEVAFSRDGRWLVTQGGDSIMLWELGTGRAPVRLSGATGEGSSGGFVLSPDASRLAADGPHGTRKVWSLDTRRELYTIKGSPGPNKNDNYIHASVFSPDGRWLATGESDGTIKLWDAATGRELRTVAHALPPHKKSDPPPGQPAPKKSHLQMIQDGLKELVPGISMRALTFSPDGKLLASVDVLNMVRVHDVASGRVALSFRAYHEGFGGGVGALIFSPDGRMLATGDIGGAVRIWDAETGAELRRMSEPTPLNAMDSNLSNPNRQLETLVYRSDGKYVAALSLGGRVQVWEVETGRRVLTLVGRAGMRHLDWSPDSRFFVTSNFDGAAHLWDAATGEPRASLVTVGRGDWMVVSPDGLFDGTPPAWNKILWRFSPEMFDVQPVEAFFNEFFHPGLLDDIMLGKRPRAVQGITQKDRRPPRLKIELATALPAGGQLASREVTVRIEVAEAPADTTRPRGGGARDVRLFRNGSLVTVWRGDLELRGGRAVIEATIPIVAGDNLLTAYAFNRDNIKSGDSTLTLRGAESLRRKGTLYVIAVGVNKYTNARYNLNYTSEDVQNFSAEVRRQQERVGRYERVESITLLNEKATKGRIVSTLRQLAERVQPEDGVFVYFSGHGVAQGDRFYLIPHDLGYDGPRTPLSAAGLRSILSHSISDLELEAAFRSLDVGQFLLIIDACNSGQALEAEEKRRGPMNSKGLAQLAYEKGMYILTASQSYELAFESDALKSSYLNYALVVEGLRQEAADGDPADGQLLLREWVDYATARVPRLRQERIERTTSRRSRSLDEVPAPPAGGMQRPRVFYRREPDTEPFIIAMKGNSP